MRKLKLQMQITLDGFNSTGPNDEQRWVTWDLDGIKQYEFHFFVNPIAIGKGASAFEQLKTWQPFELKKTITCDSGLVILHYNKA